MDVGEALGEQVDRGVDVLDGNHRLHRVHDPEIGHRGNVNAHVVTGDDALRLDRHRHNPQRHPHQPIDHWDDHGQPWVLNTHHLAEAEQHTLLVLGHHFDRQRQRDQGDNEEHRNQDDQNFHGSPYISVEGT